MKSPKLLFMCFFLLGALSYSQDISKSIQALKDNTQAKVTINQNSGIAEFVKFPPNQALNLKGNTLQDKALDFLSNYKGIFSLNSIDGNFIIEKPTVDNYGLKRLVVSQVYNGVSVYDGKLYFHFNSQDELTAVNGNYIPITKLNHIPTISKEESNTIALQTIRDQGLNVSGKELEINNNTLFLFQKGLAQGYLGANYLVYEVEVQNKLDVREFVFVNAHNGMIVEQFTGMHDINRVLFEETTSNQIWQEGDSFPGLLDQWQQNELQAAEHIYNLFNNSFGYVSFDGADAQMITINNSTNFSCPNARWNGLSAEYCSGTASDDVVAHEWGHAYTQYTSDLIYQWQSGAINESFSDIWGETVDLLNNYEDADEDNSLRTNCSSSARWIIGEDATTLGSGNGIRDMWNPTCYGNPGKITDGEYYCGTLDFGGVHLNSGIPNHAYALLVDGGSYNGQVINGLGFTKSAHIFWRTQSQYLTATSNFVVLADALEASASDLIGIDLMGLSTGASSGLSGEIITSSDVAELSKVILAVELRINPDACGFTTILEPISEICEASTSNPIFSEDWETGMDGWIVEQVPVNASTWESRDWEVSNSLPVERNGNAIFGTDPINGNCSSDLENGIIRLISPIITMPNYTIGTFDMSFTHYVATEANWDGGNIKYSLDGGVWTLLPASAFVENAYNETLNNSASGNDNPMEGQVAFTGTDEGSLTSTWGTSVINLSSIGVNPNSTIQFRFEMGTDGCNGNDGWYIDDITIYNCSEVLSTVEFDELESIVRVYPNPTTGIFTLQKTNKIDLIKAEIYDINGRFIKSVDLSDIGTTNSISITEVSSGIYFMTVISRETKGVIKLIKQ